MAACLRHHQFQRSRVHIYQDTLRPFHIRAQEGVQNLLVYSGNVGQVVEMSVVASGRQKPEIRHEKLIKHFDQKRIAG